MRTSTKERKPMSYREGSEKSGKMRYADVEIEIKTGSKKKGSEGEMEEPEKEDPEEEEMDSSAGRRPRGSRKRSAKGAKNTKAPMDAEGSCSCGKKGKACSCGKAMKDAGCGMKKRSDALTAPEYLAACELGIQDRSRTYIRARLDVMDARNDLKCGKGAISQGEKCHKGPATRVSPENAAAKANKKKSGINWNKVTQVGLVAGAVGFGAALSHRSAMRQRAGLQAQRKQMARETAQELSAISTRIAASASERAVTQRRLNANTRQLNLTMRRARTTTNQMLQGFDRRLAERTAGQTPMQRRNNRALGLSIEQLGQAAQDFETFNRIMRRPKAPVLLTTRRRKSSGTVRRSTRSPYADGFLPNFDQLAI